MMRPWIGIALLAGSWLLGLDYYEMASPWAYAVTLLAGFWMLVDFRGEPCCEDRRKLNLTGLILFLPVVCFAPWPYRIAPLAIAVGLAIRLWPKSSHWVRSLASAAITGGMILLVQMVFLHAYSIATARTHDLSQPLPAVFAKLCSLVGIDASSDGSSLIVQSMRQTHRLALTWDIVFDPVTLGLLVGGVTWIFCQAARRNVGGKRWLAWTELAGRLVLVVLAWLPIRTLALVAIYLHRAMRSDWSQTPHLMNQFFSPWLLPLLLAVPVLLAWRWIQLPDENADEDAKDVPKPKAAKTFPQTPSGFWSGEDWSPAAVKIVAIVSCLLGALLLALGLQWEPAGTRKQGRVKFVERHSPWSPTDRPYDTRSFGGDDEKSASYNYNLAYKYLGQYYDMSRLTENDAIDDATLADCDVLAIKIPRFRYTPEEVAAVTRFVHSGGGLLLIGDHTNLERSGAYMNDIARWFGFAFRDDVVYSSQLSPNREHYTAPRVPHPAIQHVPEFDFAVSCSIDPGMSAGQPVVVASGLWNMPGNYHYSNYMPPAQHLPESRFGPFIQAWSTRYGQGRVVAWGDSTIFSNFCLLQPGKATVLLNIVEWLNHRGNSLSWILMLLGVATIGNSLRMVRGDAAVWIVLVGGAACGWVAGSAGAASMNARAMRLPEKANPMPLVMIDRTTSRAPLATGDSNDDKQGGGFGLTEQWISRLGYITERAEGDDVFRGDAVVMICPSRPGSEQFRNRLVEYVREGGRLLVIDAGKTNALSTSNQILRPFGLSVSYAENWRGELVLAEPWPRLDVDNAWEVLGGESVATFDGTRPVCSKIRFGKGTVMAIGFGSFFNDRNMGGDWGHVPNAIERERYNVLFAILQNFMEDKTIEIPAGFVKPKESKPDGKSKPAPKAKKE